MKPGEEKEVKWTHSHTHGDEVHSHDYDINVKDVPAPHRLAERGW